MSLGEPAWAPLLLHLNARFLLVGADALSLGITDLPEEGQDLGISIILIRLHQAKHVVDQIDRLAVLCNGKD